MNKRAIYAIGIIITVCLVLESCSKQIISTRDKLEFCLHVQESNFDKTGRSINDFLDGLKKDNPDDNLENLVNWLESINCVDHVSILCNSCIETYPPQSELQVGFMINGQLVPMIMDIKMSEPLKFLRYH